MPDQWFPYPLLDLWPKIWTSVRLSWGTIHRSWSTRFTHRTSRRWSIGSPIGGMSPKGGMPSLLVQHQCLHPNRLVLVLPLVLVLVLPWAWSWFLPSVLVLALPSEPGPGLAAIWSWSAGLPLPSVLALALPIGPGPGSPMAWSWISHRSPPGCGVILLGLI